MNRFKRLSARIHKLSQTLAEVWIIAEAEEINQTTEVRGRIMGPRCAGATTVEVAYALQPIYQVPKEVPTLSRRSIIPEPSLWEPSQPFLYRALVELWQDGKCWDRAELEFGLKMTRKGADG